MHVFCKVHTSRYVLIKRIILHVDQPVFKGVASWHVPQKGPALRRWSPQRRMDRSIKLITFIALGDDYTVTTWTQLA